MILLDENSRGICFQGYFTLLIAYEKVEGCPMKELDLSLHLVELDLFQIVTFLERCSSGFQGPREALQGRRGIRVISVLIS